MPSSTRASGRFLAVGQSGQTGKRTVSAHPYFKVRRRQGRKQLEKGPLKETKKGTRLALSKRSQLALFCCSVPLTAFLQTVSFPPIPFTEPEPLSASLPRFPPLFQGL